MSLATLWFGGSGPINTHPSGVELRKPPPCLRNLASCDTTSALWSDASACRASAAAAPYYASASPLAPRLDAPRMNSLRVFFLEGHVGPMNDMLATLHDGLGMNVSGVEGMMFMQGMINRNQIE